MKLTTDKNNRKTRIFFGVLFFVCFFFEASLAPFIGVSFDGGKTHITGDLLFALSIACGMLCDDRRFIGIIALVFGAMSDFFLTPASHLSPILFFLAAYFGAYTIGVFTSQNAATAAVASLPFFLLRLVSGAIYLLSIPDSGGLSALLQSILLPELVCNVVAAFCMYLVVGFLYKRFKRRFYL